MTLNILTNYSTALLTTLAIGGPARYYCTAATLEEMKKAFAFADAHGLRLLIIGRGSNLLIDDAGFDGLIIQNRIDHYVPDGALFTCGGGMSFPLLAQRSTANQFGGMEFAVGIPGSIGGAIAMNAGASGSQTADHLLSVTFLHRNGHLQIYQREELDFSYRSSPFLTMEGAIIEATFGLYQDPEAKKKMLEILHYRRSTQPYSDRSAGCIFCNPEQTVGMPSAGALIDRAGLKGHACGDAAVSTLHANFLINRHQATFQEMKELINHVQNVIYEKEGIYLTPEVRIISPS